MGKHGRGQFERSILAIGPEKKPHSTIQSSSRKLGTRLNSRVLCVTSIRSSQSAIPAISTSYGRIRWPAVSSPARTLADTSAPAWVSGKTSSDPQNLRHNPALCSGVWLRKAPNNSSAAVTTDNATSSCAMAASLSEDAPIASSKDLDRTIRMEQISAHRIRRTSWKS